LKPGDSFTVRAGGGGGFGPAAERDPEKVAWDVRQGYVSLGAARDLYRVALDPKTLELDAAETAKLRGRGGAGSQV
jgi:N-methylhydantoinase B